MKISELITDDAILSELGARLSRHRLDLQLTQADVAEQAGIAKRTLERIEAGASAQVSSLIRVLRVLQLLPLLEQAIPIPDSRPLEMLKRKGKARRRASKSRKSNRPDKPWSWGEDT